MKLLEGFNRFGQSGIISSTLNKFNILFQCINIAEKSYFYSSIQENFSCSF